MRSLRQVCLAAALIAAGACARASAEPLSSLHSAWEQADHCSGIYYAKAAATLQVIIENPTDHPLPLDGSITFGPQANDADFKPTSITPIAPTTLGAGERAKLPLTLNFGAAGPYQLRWQHADKSSTLIEGPGAVTFQAIFAPRSVGDNSWITLLPRQAATVPGYLTDLMAQTTVRRFLIDERFAFDPAANVGLALGASLKVPEGRVIALFDEAAKAKAQIVLRVVVPLAKAPDPKNVLAFGQYIAQAAARLKGTLKAIAVVPDTVDHFSPDQRSAYRQYYLAAYDAAKKSDKNIAFLGAANAQATRDLLMSELPAENLPSLRPYVDALAITDLVAQLPVARELAGDTKIPLWVLPPAGADPWTSVPPAAALAEDAAVAPVPPPALDRGVTAHLLGGTVFFQKVHPKNLPWIATFQGDGYAVAAVAGLAAATSLDTAFPGLARTKSSVAPLEPDEKPAYGAVEVPDDTRSLRVVDAAGSPVDCRVGDELFVPATDHIVYVLQAGNAEDLSALLRPAEASRLPVIEITASLAPSASDQPGALLLRLTNITLDETAGTLKIILPPTPHQKTGATLAESKLAALAPGKSIDLSIPLERPLPPGPLILEFTTRHLVQRTAILPVPPPSPQPRG